MRAFFQRLMPDSACPFRIRNAVAALCFLSAALASVTAQTRREDRPPNIVVILADDLGYGDLSSYGAKDLKTPNIDKLVASGIRFDRFYANCPVCSPTRAALLTGRYPDVVGVPGVIRSNPLNNWGFLSSESVLLPKVLEDAGYETGLVGKWHLGLERPNTPNERGFETFHGFLGDMMDDYYSHLRHGTNYMRWNEEIIDPKGHATDLFTDWSVEYLNARARQEKPFFLYLAYNAPHTPIQPPEEWLVKVKQRSPNMEEKRARLVALIEHMDDGIGKVIAALGRNNQARNTLVIFTSDNGGQLSAGANCGTLRGGKQDMYEGGIRVPMCAVWPGRIRAGDRSDQVALTMDLFATVCDVAGVGIRHPIDGVSLLPAMAGKESEISGRDLVWMRREGGGRYLGQDYYAFRRGDWKLVQNHPFEPFQLYNLAKDPLEDRDLARAESGVFRRMTSALQAHLQRSGSVPWQFAR